jgi:hypothetical protein
MDKLKDIKKIPTDELIKYIYYSVCGILAFAILVCVTISLMGYVKEKNRLAAMDEKLSSLVQTSVTTAQSALEEWGQADDKTLEFVNDYIENINNAESVRQKSYIAQSMLAYVAKIITYSNFFLKEDADEAAGENPTPIQTYDRIETRMNNLVLQLNAAREFDNDAAQTADELNEE